MGAHPKPGGATEETRFAAAGLPLPDETPTHGPTMRPSTQRLDAETAPLGQTPCCCSIKPAALAAGLASTVGEWP
jgi:hypothetical protein